MTIRRFDDAEAVSRAAADEFTRIAHDSVAGRGRFTVVFSGGSTPRRLYQLLAGAPWREQIDWPRVEVFWGDERAVPPDHPDSNYGMAREALLAKVPVSSDKIHRIEAERADRDAVARDYQDAIARAFGVPADGEPPAFDLVLLGMGPDGHTASLFPGTVALEETVHWVVPNYVPRLQAHRVTLTPRILNRARQVAFLVAGADKAVPLAEVLEGPLDAVRLPSQLIRPDSGSLTWLVDHVAASKLRQPAQ